MPKDFVAGNNSEEVQEQSEVAETLEEEAAEPVEEHETETENVEEEETVETDEDAESDEDESDEASDEDESDDDDADADFVAKKEEGTDSTELAAEEDEDKDEEDVTENACGDKKKYSLTEEEFFAIQSELESLRAFKLSIENKEKDALIDKYHMLSDEDKADIIAHKEEYTLEQIEEKLALVYVKNNVDFSTVDGHKETNKEEVESLLNFSLDDSNDSAEVVSDMQAAFREMEL